MTKLLKSHREEIAQRVVDGVRVPREARLRERERALATKLIRWRYGASSTVADLNARIAALREAA